jgi:hypothetical protein
MRPASFAAWIRSGALHVVFHLVLLLLDDVLLDASTAAAAAAPGWFGGLGRLIE